MQQTTNQKPCKQEESGVKYLYNQHCGKCYKEEMTLSGAKELTNWRKKINILKTDHLNNCSHVGAPVGLSR